MSKVSVIMPIYQTREDFLRSAIDSVLTQSFTDFEFLILNDSPNCTYLQKIINSYNDSRIKYYENSERLGIAKSYNRLLELAQCEYIAMMNHDDISYPHRLEKQVNYLDTHPEIGVVGSGYKKFGEFNRFKSIINHPKDSQIRSLFLFKSPLSHPTAMYRRSVVIENGVRYNDNYISLNDRQFFYDMSKYTKLANISEVLYKYRFHSQMASKIYHPEIIAEKYMFNNLWLKDNNIDFSQAERDILNNYITNGRCKIKDISTMQEIADVLDKLYTINIRQKILPVEEFTNVCIHYLVKRSWNALIYGKINPNNIIKNSLLSQQSNMLLNICNLALLWRA